MKNKKFKDRKKETKELSETLNKKGFAFEIIYGRRRVGKTELVLNAVKNKKYVYYLATGERNIERFYNACINFDGEMKNLKQDYEILFNYLKDKAEVVVLDEFQNFIKENPNFLNLLQSIIDTNLKNSNLKLIILGSSVSMITSKVLSYQSPLYGRKTASLKLKSVKFFDLNEFFPKLKIERLIEIYGFADGIPFYLNKIQGNFWDWLNKEIKSDKGFLKDEVDFLMKFEFDDSSTYKLILQSISFGKNTIKEIKDFSKLQRTDISPYIKNLIEVGLIRREVPINENIKSRRGRYFLQDNFVRFWFRYIYPNLSSLEQGIYKTKDIKPNYSEYLSNIFEEICMEYLTLTDLKFSKMGRWWYKENEIDIIALNEKENKVFFSECKYKENVDPERILRKLEKKTDSFKWNNESRKENYIIFAKSFRKKINIFNKKKVYCFDLQDFINKISKNRQHF